MLIRPLISLTLAAMAGLVFTLSAEANPRFKVENTTDSKIDVHIFNGDDTSCHTANVVRTVSSKETKSLGCKGNGKGKCKIKLTSDDGRVCKDSRNTCGRRAIKMQAKSKAIVRETTETDEETGVTKTKTVCEIIDQK
ncbi:MAG: hypothetical protein AAFN76_06145 [Pseudomonadota bacterium]